MSFYLPNSFVQDSRREARMPVKEILEDPCYSRIPFPVGIQLLE